MQVHAHLGVAAVSQVSLSVCATDLNVLSIPSRLDVIMSPMLLYVSDSV